MMAFNFERRGGETGRMYEANLLGTFKMTPGFLAAEALLRRNRRGHYADDEDLYRAIKEHTIDDPTNPEAQQANDLRLAVIDALGLPPGEEDLVTYYTAVGSPLDVKMGVDAFIEFEDPKTGRKSRATIDVTLNKRKIEEEYGKADIIIGELPDAVAEEDEYLEAIGDYGHRTAQKLMLESKRIRRAA